METIIYNSAYGAKNIEPMQRFGKLRVLGEAPRKVDATGKGHRMANCICDCGNECVRNISHLVNGQTFSCGCKQAEFRRNRLWKNARR